MSKDKKVCVTLKDIYIGVNQPETITDELLEELTRLAVMKAFNENPDKLTNFSMARPFDAEYLFEHEIYPGRVVLTSANEVGIVFCFVETTSEIEKHRINVILPGHRIYNCAANTLRPVDATFNEARALRLNFARADNIWNLGDTAYIQHRNELVPVVIGTVKKGKQYIYEVSCGSKPKNVWAILPHLLDRYLIEFKNLEELQRVISSETVLEFRKHINAFKEELPMKEQEALLLLYFLLYSKKSSDYSIYYSSNNYVRAIQNLLEVTPDTLMAKLAAILSNIQEPVKVSDIATLNKAL